MIKGLDLKNLDSVVVKWQLEEFIDVLKLLERRTDIKKVEIIVGELSDGRKFSRLKDGITRRRYIIGKIIVCDGRECSLIEVEREDKSLSRVILKNKNNVSWKKVYSILLVGLINESGKWSTKVNMCIEKNRVSIYRNRHSRKSVYEKEKQIFDKLMLILDKKHMTRE